MFLSEEGIVSNSGNNIYVDCKNIMQLKYIYIFFARRYTNLDYNVYGEVTSRN